MKAAMAGRMVGGGGTLPSQPMRKLFPACCASEVSGVRATLRMRTTASLISRMRTSVGMAGALLDYLICPQQHRLRDRQAEGFGGLEIDQEFELGRLRDRQVGRLRAF